MSHNTSYSTMKSIHVSLTWLSTSMAMSMNMSWSSLMDVSSLMMSACLASMSARVCLAAAVSMMIPCVNTAGFPCSSISSSSSFVVVLPAESEDEDIGTVSALNVQMSYLFQAAFGSSTCIFLDSLSASCCTLSSPGKYLQLNPLVLLRWEEKWK